MNDSEFDARLSALLSPQDEPVDHAFTSQVMQMVEADAAYRWQQSRLVTDWLWQAAGFVAILAGVILFSRSPLFDGFAQQGLFKIASPLMAVFALWLFASDIISQPGIQRGPKQKSAARATA